MEKRYHPHPLHREQMLPAFSVEKEEEPSSDIAEMRTMKKQGKDGKGQSL